MVLGPIRSDGSYDRRRIESEIARLESLLADLRRIANGRVPFRGSSDRLRLVERFTPVAVRRVEWSVTMDDPGTWTRPWTFAMRLTQVDEPPFEYACHEGNYAMRNILGIARAQEAAQKKP